MYMKKCICKFQIFQVVNLQCQFCHPPLVILKKVLLNFDDTNNELSENSETHSKSCLAYKHYQTTIPELAVCNLLDPLKMSFNRIVSINLRQRNDKLFIYMIGVITRNKTGTFIKNKCKETIID